MHSHLPIFGKPKYICILLKYWIRIYLYFCLPKITTRIYQFLYLPRNIDPNIYAYLYLSLKIVLVTHWFKKIQKLQKKLSKHPKPSKSVQNHPQASKCVKNDPKKFHKKKISQKTFFGGNGSKQSKWSKTKIKPKLKCH